jgi:hypothetical protein
LNADSLRIFGLAYFPDDPDGYNLYIQDSPDLEATVIKKMNIETEVLVSVDTLVGPAEGSPRGCEITNQWDIYSWVLLSVVNNAANDRVDIWQIDARKDWFDIGIESGLLNAGNRQEFTLALDATTLPTEVFEGYLHFTHNAYDGVTDIPVRVDVRGPGIPSPFDLAYPQNGDSLRTLQIAFGWQRSNDEEMPAYILHVETRLDTVMLTAEDTTLTVGFDTLEFIFDPDRPLLTWWVYAVSEMDTVRSTSSFVAWYLPVAAPEDDIRVPVEFGIHSVHPNPFNAVTSIEYGIEEAGAARLSLYDLNGRLVNEIHTGVRGRGTYRLDYDSGSLASGIYILRLQSGRRISQQKVSLVK